MSYQLVWFKRDLRCEDHAALTKAAQLGPVRCIYVQEPKLWDQPDVALQHFEFIKESLQDLDADLRQRGGQVEIHVGEVSDVLTKIWQQNPFQGIHSHEETGNQFTYARDEQVAAWCESHNISWVEYPQFGVLRGLKNRNLWHAGWQKHMEAPLHELSHINFWRAPLADNAGSNAGSHQLTPAMMEAPKHLLHNPPHRQRGGRKIALATFKSFLEQRSAWYRGGISSPITAPDACSRLSVYMTYGCISIREVVQATNEELLQMPPYASRQKSGLVAFMSRLYWHCHFIQKLESEPEIEWQNMHRGYDGLREKEFNQEYFAALKEARTGWPMVDACVVMLRETGWLNFRMRAMLVSTAAYPLWLHWRPVGEWLATQFLDYEPGIHWSQLQMQSGTTGINVTRVYNPIKQAQDHDEKGYFVRKWLPYMRQVPDPWIFEPWKMTADMHNTIGLELSKKIPIPIVDLTAATKTSKDRLYERRNFSEVRAGKKSVVEKHASRASNSHRRSPKPQTVDSKDQLKFEF